MILIKRRRYFFWLLKAYLKKWGKTIFISFLFGLAIFFAIYYAFVKFIIIFPITEKETIGMVGPYTVNNLPSEILSKLSKGLTVLSENFEPTSGLASKWYIKDSGKTYIFRLNKNVHFSDGSEVTSATVNYNFLDVKVERPDKYTIIFKLKDNYSPFLTTASQPVFKNNFIGVGDYQLKSIKLNGNFVESLEIVPSSMARKVLIYQFYATEKAVKTAYALGEITKAKGLSDINYKNTSFKNFKNSTIEKTVDHSKMVAIFYDTADSVVSDKRLRQALTYSVNDKFSYGQRNYGPYSPFSWASREITGPQQDFTHAKLLMSQSESSTKSANIKLKIKVLSKYKDLALDIKKSWEKVGVESEIETIDSLPSSFQVFIGDFNLAKDPDQYTLWHSEQSNNITNYKNLRIDKLLEDGRQTIELDKRKKIYSDFQKYLLDDSPVTFLLFPYSYTVNRN